MPRAHLWSSYQQTLAAVLVAASSLMACGGGGDATATATGNTLDVSVTTDNVSTSPDSGAYRVANPSTVKITCAKACTFTKGSNSGVTVSQETTTSTTWSARLSFGSDAASLAVRADAADGSTATVVLKPQTIPTGGAATWSMDSLSWARTNSTQNTSTAYWDNQPVVTTALAMTASGTPCETASFRCSTVSIHFAGAEPGDYTIDPNFMTKGIKTPGTAWVNVKLTGGRPSSGVGYYNDDYRPTSGTIRVTKANGTYFFNTVGSVLVTHLDGSDGDPSAIATMLFKLSNGH